MKLLPTRWRWRLLARAKGGAAAARAVGARVGSDCRILSFNVNSEHELVSIGDRVTVSSNVTFITHDGAGWLIRDECGRRYFRRAPIQIGNDVFIGAGATLMPGVRIGNRVIVAAAAVVTKSIPDGYIVGGNPARVIGSFASWEKRVRQQWTVNSARFDGSMKPHLK